MKIHWSWYQHAPKVSNCCTSHLALTRWRKLASSLCLLKRLSWVSSMENWSPGEVQEFPLTPVTQRRMKGACQSQ